MRLPAVGLRLERHMRLSTLSVVVALALAPACKNKDEANMEKMVSVIEDLGKVVDGAGGDCGKMASGVESIVTDSEADLKELKSWAEGLKQDKEKAKKFADKYASRIQKAMPGMMGMMKCADDPKMKAMEAKLKGLI
jgi:hypothetical protein